MFFENWDHDGRAPISTSNKAAPNHTFVVVAVTLCCPVLFRDDSIYSDDHIKSHKPKNIYFTYIPPPHLFWQSNNQGLICAWDVINDLVGQMHSGILVPENQD